MALGMRLKQAREKAGLTQGQLAKAAGITQAAISALEKRDSDSSSHAFALAKACHVRPEWLLSGEEPMQAAATVSLRPMQFWDNEEELNEEEYFFLPQLNIRLSAGNGNIVWHVDEKGQRQAFRRAWGKRLGIRPEQAATMVAAGESMEPRIQDGDSLVIDYKQQHIIDGKIYAIAYAGEVYVKRLFKQIGGGLRIVSDNPDKIRYPDVFVTQENMQHLQIIGRVVALSGGV